MNFSPKVHRGEFAQNDASWVILTHYCDAVCSRSSMLDSAHPSCWGFHLADHNRFYLLILLTLESCRRRLIYIRACSCGECLRRFTASWHATPFPCSDFFTKNFQFYRQSVAVFSESLTLLNYCFSESPFRIMPRIPRWLGITVGVKTTAVTWLYFFPFPAAFSLNWIPDAV